jgi:hypothetical protein
MQPLAAPAPAGWQPAAQNLTQIKVAQASICFAVIARSLIDKRRAGHPSSRT